MTKNFKCDECGKTYSEQQGAYKNFICLDCRNEQIMVAGGHCDWCHGLIPFRDRGVIRAPLLYCLICDKAMKTDDKKTLKFRYFQNKVISK